MMVDDSGHVIYPLAYLLGVALVTLYRASHYGDGFAAYWRERPREAIAGASLALILAFLWFEEWIPYVLNGALEAVFRPDPAGNDTTVPNVRVTLYSSVAAGAALDWFGVRIVREILSLFPWLNGRRQPPKDDEPADTFTDAPK